MIYDLIIIGNGPAGLEAAITAKLKNINFLIFGSNSNTVQKAPLINNYLGLPNISGKALYEAFLEHIKFLDISLIMENVTAIYALGSSFSVSTSKETYEAKSVILATGINYKKDLPGEEEYLGQGVSYCATCDAPLYRGKTVTVIGHNDEALLETRYISKLAKKVFYVPQGKTIEEEKVQVINDTPIKITKEKNKLTLVLKNQKIETDGLFIIKDAKKPSSLVPGLKMDGPHILVNKEMETNIKGLYACGDVIGKPYQFMKSASEGQLAALKIIEYIEKN